MESLNLNNLATSLPSSSYSSLEAELHGTFRIAAQSVTDLYRAQKRTSTRAYNAGYAAACGDLLAMVQQSVSAPSTSSASAGAGDSGIMVARIMDYIDARLAAIKAREEEEDEEEKAADKPSTSTSASLSKPRSASPKPRVREAQPVAVAPPTPDSSPVPVPPRPFAVPPAPLSLPSPSPQPFRALASLKGKSRLVSTNPKDFAFDPPALTSITPMSPPEPLKRRREPGEAVTEAGTSRRRTRSQLVPRPPPEQQANASTEAMDVEEDGPARKRVSRR